MVWTQGMLMESGQTKIIRDKLFRHFVGMCTLILFMSSMVQYVDRLEIPTEKPMTTKSSECLLSFKFG